MDFPTKPYGYGENMREVTETDLQLMQMDDDGYRPPPQKKVETYDEYVTRILKGKQEQ